MEKTSRYEEEYMNHPKSDFIYERRKKIKSEWYIYTADEDNPKISLLNFMEEYYPNFVGLELERLRDQEQQIIYAEYLEAKKNGDQRNFERYALEEYGFDEIDHEEDLALRQVNKKI